MTSVESRPVLSVKNLQITSKDPFFQLVKGVSFEIKQGHRLALVGESGSGKSLICRAISGLLPQGLSSFADEMSLQNGTEKINLSHNSKQEKLSCFIGYVFQEPMSALNPVLPVGRQVQEAIEHEPGTWSEKKQRVLYWLDKVKLPAPETTYKKYPHQLSGGQRQRIVIAMAMIKNPILLIADEPTTALDVIVQAEIVELIAELCREGRTSLLFVSHDLDLVAKFCTDILVIRHGVKVEYGDLKAVIRKPNHPYTRALLLSKPRLDHKPLRLPVVSDFIGEKNTLNSAAKAGFVSDVHQQKTRHPVVTLRSIYKVYRQSNNFTEAISGLDLELFTGETVGLVGPSGCGKSTLARILCGIEKPDSGEVIIHRQGRRADVVQLVFQDPYSSLNPALSIGSQVMEPLIAKGISRDTARKEAMEMLKITGIEPERFSDYPHRFSGGQRQRIAIARALILKPALVVLDESVAALDVSVQAVVINLLNDLKDAFGLSYLFITHNLVIAQYFCDKILVMYQGKIVDSWSGKLPESLQHPFSQRLLQVVKG